MSNQRSRISICSVFLYARMPIAVNAGVFWAEKDHMDDRKTQVCLDGVR